MVAAFTIGEGLIVALAARQDMPREMADLARVEGVSPWYLTRRVTLGLMAPTPGLIAGRDIAISLQSVFATTYLITARRPVTAWYRPPIVMMGG